MFIIIIIIIIIIIGGGCSKIIKKYSLYMGVGYVAVCYGYTLLYEAQLVFMILIVSAALIRSGTMGLLCGFYLFTTTDDNYKI